MPSRHELWIGDQRVCFWVQEVSHPESGLFPVRGLVALCGRELRVLDEPAEWSEAHQYGDGRLAHLYAGEDVGFRRVMPERVTPERVPDRQRRPA